MGELPPEKCYPAGVGARHDRVDNPGGTCLRLAIPQTNHSRFGADRCHDAGADSGIKHHDIFQQSHQRSPRSSPLVAVFRLPAADFSAMTGMPGSYSIPKNWNCTAKCLSHILRGHIEVVSAIRANFDSSKHSAYVA